MTLSLGMSGEAGSPPLVVPIVTAHYCTLPISDGTLEKASKFFKENSITIMQQMGQ